MNALTDAPPEAAQTLNALLHEARCLDHVLDATQKRAVDLLRDGGGTSEPTADLCRNIEAAVALAVKCVSSNICLHLDLARISAQMLASCRDLSPADAQQLQREIDVRLRDARAELATRTTLMEREQARWTTAPELPAARGSATDTVHTSLSLAALRLTRLATLVLPTNHRIRYQEECAAELAELAALSRRAQWRYSLALVPTMWMLRRVLKRADRRPVLGRWLR